MAAHLWIKIVTDNGGQIGPGKIALLKAIAAHGSISAAARTLGMSYRRAWLLVEEAGEAAGAPVVETRIGGARRGGTALTENGMALIEVYENVVARANEAAAPNLGAFFAHGRH